MRKTCWIILMAVICAGALTISAAEKPRVGVLRFTNQTSAGWWSASVGNELSDMLASELASTEKFAVLERKEIDAVLGEQDLSASGRVNSATAVKMKKLKGAKFLIAGTVSAYEENTSNVGGGASFKGISLGAKKDKTYIAVDLKVVNTETGEIVDAKTIEATSKGVGVGGGLSLRNFSVAGGAYKKTPAGKAIRACIVYISEYLSCSMVEGKNAPCMDEWRARDSKRREKTKSSIKLD